MTRLRNNHHQARSQSKDLKAKEIKRLRTEERVCDMYAFWKPRNQKIGKLEKLKYWNKGTC